MPTVLGLQHPLGVQTGTEQSGALGNNRSAFSKCWRGTYCGSVFTRNPFPTPSPTTSPVQHRLCPSCASASGGQPRMTAPLRLWGAGWDAGWDAARQREQTQHSGQGFPRLERTECRAWAGRERGSAPTTGCPTQAAQAGSHGSPRGPAFCPEGIWPVPPSGVHRSAVLI